MGFNNPVEMNDNQYTTISINGEVLNGKDLMFFCRKKLSDQFLPTWERSMYQFIQDWVSPLLYINIKTSGSTGSPKWIEVNKEKMIRSALMTGQYFSLKKNDRTLLCLPVDYIAGKMMVVRSFVLGLNLIPMEPSGNPLEKTHESYDFGAMTPMQISNILAKKEGGDKLNGIAKLIVGGAEINQGLLSKVGALKNEIWQTYGMTETITHVAVRKLNSAAKSENYHALPHVSFLKDNRDCLVINAPHLNEEKVITNDIVELINDREFRFTGRYDNVINTGGIKISPEETESKLSPFIDDRFIISGLPDDKLGQKLVLIIEGKGLKNINLEVLAETAGLSKYETPKQVICSPSFPLTENGKIIRHKVIEKFILLQQ
jgi:O-succinylbenzoic acid--CoA ligase